MPSVGGRSTRPWPPRAHAAKNTNRSRPTAEASDPNRAEPPAPPAAAAPDPAADGEGGTRAPSAAELARDYTELAIATLCELLKPDNSDRVRLGAALALLDRGWGRIGPSAEDYGDGSGEPFIPVSPLDSIMRDFDRIAESGTADDAPRSPQSARDPGTPP